MRPLSFFLLAPALVACVEAPELGENHSALNVVYTYQVTPYDGSGTKTLDLQCPLGYVGTQVSFWGQSATGNWNFLEDLVTATYPNATGDRWRVVALDLSRDPSWQLQAHLACIEPGGSYELVTASAGRLRGGLQEIEVTCPAGKVVLGAAFSPIQHLRDEVSGRATYSMPVANGTAWRMRGRGFQNDWTMRTTIVCYDALDVPDHQVVTRLEVPHAGPLAYGVARCPTPDFETTGGGWSVRDQGGALLEGTAYYDQRWPPHGHPMQFPGQWESMIYLFSGFSKPVTTETAVICI